MRCFSIGYGSLLIIFSWGCTVATPGTSLRPVVLKDSTEYDPAKAKHAWVFVDGIQHGTTPTTVQIQRSFEISSVSLHLGEDFTEVRRYEFERSVTSNRVMQDFTFQGNYDGQILTFTPWELSRDKKDRFMIPFYRQPVQVIDHEYDLVIIVAE